MILEGEIRKVDVCFLNDQPFVYVAGFGNFIPISYETPKLWKRRYGYFAYVIEGIHSLTKPLQKTEFEYWCDGEQKKTSASFVLVSNAARIAGIDFFYRDVKLDDGKFEVLFCNLTEKKKILKALYQLKTKGIDHVEGCETLKVQQLTILFSHRPRKFWCVDGERFPSEDLKYEIKMQAQIAMLLPKKNISQLFLR